MADICGKTGRQAAAHMIKPLKEKFGAQYVVANVENAAGGFGITPEMSRKMFTYGINTQTSGNHIWDRVDILEYFDSDPKLLRPANYPPGAPGAGWLIDTIGEIKIGVVNVMGRTYMPDNDCPFRVAKRLVTDIQRETNVIVMDLHAEATSEKQALAYYLDGMVSAVIGTHTHVQTADEQISERGTAYITDAGMTGPYDSIIGMEKGPSLGRFLTGMPKRFRSASGNVKISGVAVRIDASSGQAEHIERFCVPFDLANVKNEIHVEED